MVTWQNVQAQIMCFLLAQFTCSQERAQKPLESKSEIFLSCYYNQTEGRQLFRIVIFC